MKNSSIKSVIQLQMKVIKGLFIVLLVISTSCNEEEFLDVQPKGALAGSSLENEAGVEGLVTSAYAALIQLFEDLPAPGIEYYAYWYAASNWSYSDVRSDDIYKGGDNTGDQDQLHALEVHNILADNGYLNPKWRALYMGVKRCNIALQTINKLPEGEMTNKDSRIGELLVLRTHFYFDLVKIFKQVPYINEYVPNVNEDYRAIHNLEYTHEELLELLEEDLKRALPLLPETQPEVGRVNKYVCHAYLAKINLYTKDYAEAEEHAEAVIASGNYSLFPDLQLMWEAEYEHAGEYVFAMETSIDDGTAFGHVNWGNLLNTPRGPAYTGDHFVRPTQNLVNAYRTDANGLPIIDNFNDTNITMDDFTDPRLDHFIGRLGVPWKNWSADVYEDTSEWIYNETWIRNSGDYGIYSMKKLIVSPESEFMVSGWPWGASAANFPFIRYAEVLFIKAEALIEQNKDLDEARVLINQVRERAMNAPTVKQVDGVTDAANYNIGLYPAVGWTQDYARKAVRFERRIELCMEGHRFFDLVRWGIAPEALNKYSAEEFPNSGVADYLNDVIFVENKHEYLPTPQDQIDISGGFYTQIEGYR